MFASFNTLFKKNCLYYPKRKALSYRAHTYSYEELTRRSNQLAYYFKKQGIKKGMIVAVISKNYLERIVSTLSLWKLGAAYLPIDPDYPLARINFILKDSKVNFIITDKALFEKFFSNSAIVSIILEHENTGETIFAIGDLSDASDGNDVAYIAYTSGSTGKPKGVIITQSNISSMFNAWNEVYKLNYQDQHLQIANFGFDVCSGDILRALGSGSHLIVCPPDIILQPDKLYELLTEKMISVVEFNPSILRKLITYVRQQKLNLNFIRLLICGSDIWSMKEYKEFKSYLSPKARLINSYGTTETTIDSTYFEICEKKLSFFDDHIVVPLGQPFPNTIIKILNEKLLDCPTGVVGDIYIGGKGVSLGYLNQPNLTQEKFVKLTGNCETDIYYKTGDLGRYLSDGNLVFLGRADYQVKIMGYRTGILDVEAVLNRYPGVQKAVVVAHSTSGREENFLVAFVIFNQKFMINDCIVFLKNYLPTHTIPVFYLSVPFFPISDHGKLNRLELISKLTYKNAFYQKSLSVTNIEKLLLDILKTSFNMGTIINNNFFFSLDTNASLCAIFLQKINVYLKCKLNSLDLSNIHTINDLTKAIQKIIKNKNIKI